MACGAQMVGRVAAREGNGAPLGIVRQNHPCGCVQRGRIAGSAQRPRNAALTWLGWVALGLLAAGLVMLAAG